MSNRNLLNMHTHRNLSYQKLSHPDLETHRKQQIISKIGNANTTCTKNSITFGAINSQKIKEMFIQRPSSGTIVHPRLIASL